MSTGNKQRMTEAIYFSYQNYTVTITFLRELVGVKTAWQADSFYRTQRISGKNSVAMKRFSILAIYQSLRDDPFRQFQVLGNKSNMHIEHRTQFECNISIAGPIHSQIYFVESNYVGE